MNLLKIFNKTLCKTNVRCDESFNCKHFYYMLVKYKHIATYESCTVCTFVLLYFCTFVEIPTK